MCNVYLILSTFIILCYGNVCSPLLDKSDQLYCKYKLCFQNGPLTLTHHLRIWTLDIHHQKPESM